MAKAENNDALIAMAERGYEKAISAAFMEKQWTNERLNWLFVPQAILFAGLCILETNPDKLNAKIYVGLHFAIPLLAAAISLSCCIAIVCAVKMHGVWYGEATRHLDYLKSLVASNKMPERAIWMTFCNTDIRWPARWARRATIAIPVLFLGAWLGVIYLMVQVGTDFSQPAKVSVEIRNPN